MFCESSFIAQKSEAVFIYDAFSLIANTIDRHNLAEVMIAPSSVSCQKEEPWQFGSEFMKYLKMSNFNGLSGHIEFDQRTGYRKNVTFSIVDKTKSGVDLVRPSNIPRNNYLLRMDSERLN